MKRLGEEKMKSMKEEGNKSGFSEHHSHSERWREQGRKATWREEGKKWANRYNETDADASATPGPSSFKYEYKEEGVKVGEQQFKWNGEDKWKQSGEAAMKRWIFKEEGQKKITGEARVKWTFRVEQHWKGQYEEKAKSGWGEARRKREEGKKQSMEETFKQSGEYRFKHRSEEEKKSYNEEEEFKLFGDGRSGSPSPQRDPEEDGFGYHIPGPSPFRNPYMEEAGKVTYRYDEEGIKLSQGGDGGHEEAMKMDYPGEEGDKRKVTGDGAGDGGEEGHKSGDGGPWSDGGSGDGSVIVKEESQKNLISQSLSPSLNRHYEHPELFDVEEWSKQDVMKWEEREKLAIPKTNAPSKMNFEHFELDNTFRGPGGPLKTHADTLYPERDLCGEMGKLSCKHGVIPFNFMFGPILPVTSGYVRVPLPRQNDILWRHVPFYLDASWSDIHTNCSIWYALCYNVAWVLCRIRDIPVIVILGVTVSPMAVRLALPWTCLRGRQVSVLTIISLGCFWRGRPSTSTLSRFFGNQPYYERMRPASVNGLSS